MIVFWSLNGNLLSDLVWECPLQLSLDRLSNAQRGDLEIKDYVVMQKPQPQANRLPPPRTLIMDYTMTHIRFGRSHVHPMGQLTNLTQDVQMVLLTQMGL